MRLSANQYAKALYETVQGKSQSEVDLTVANFFKLLQKNGQIKLAKKIVEKFSNIWNSENGIVEAEVTSREKLNIETQKKIEQFIIKKYAAKEVVIRNIIDEKIQGGIILQVGDEMLDASVSGMLVNLKKELMK